MPDLALEFEHGAPAILVAGIDEAGRGPLAGPVYAAAVVLPPCGLPSDVAGAIDDSKVLTPETRESLLPEIEQRCLVGLGIATVAEIDRINILQATFLAMKRALKALPLSPAFALIDGNRLPKRLGCRARAVIGGDGLSLSIAAASIVAKVRRDAAMMALADGHPGYGWEHNYGYATAEHRQAIIALGSTPHHRRHFGTVREQLELDL